MKKLHATVEDIQDALELYVIQTKFMIRSSQM